MKKLISIFSLFLIFSCRYQMQEERIVVRVVENGKGRFTVYTNYDSYFDTKDSTYRVGDTLILAKKEIKQEDGK